jgi:hypothetical protein
LQDFFRKKRGRTGDTTASVGEDRH